MDRGFSHIMGRQMGQRAINAKRQARLQQALGLGREPRLARRGTTSEAELRARQFAVDAARLMADDRCEEVVVLDLRGISGVCDYFVIATGTSDRQMKAVSEHIEEMARRRGERPFSTAGLEGSSWAIIDYVDVVMHLFDAEHRRYYELETLWGDAPRVEWG
jgi:ribosome-associated protein